MMYRVRLAATLLAGLVAAAPAAVATALEVSPVGVEVTAPAAAATITLHNHGTAPINVQVRVFNWSEINGEETLKPTDDVVASPPIAALASGVNYTIRIVRVRKTAVVAGESYRLLVDELPKAPSAKASGVTVLLRYSVPVFFYSPEASASSLNWSLERRGGHAYLSATNAGDAHARIASLKIVNGSNAVVSYGDGLAGYVLGHATRTWAVPANAVMPIDLKALAVTAQTNIGPIRAPLRLAPSH
jgi:fimbrial chaperone protein